MDRLWTMGLQDLRQQIDSLDDQILALLEERAMVARAVAEEKRKVGQVTYHDPEREQRVLDRLQARSSGKFPRDGIRAVFREVMSACLSVEQPMKVAFLGPEGTFAHMAARYLFGLAARYREAPTIDGVFDAVRRGDAEAGVVPIDHAVEGAVANTIDALIEGDLVVRREAVLPSSYCLLGRGGSLSSIARVYGSVNAFGQCRGWLTKNLPGAQLVQTATTAMALREVEGDETSAVVASELAGELYGLEVLRAQVQDHSDEATRFIVISKNDAPRTGNDRTAISFALPDDSARGALRQALTILDDHGINLSRIESRPSRERQWTYVFFATLEGHRSDPAVVAGLEALAQRCPRVKVHGSYPRDRGVESVRNLPIAVGKASAAEPAVKPAG